MPPGCRWSVHVPEEGRPLSAILPAGLSREGWTIAPGCGAEGVGGWVFIATFCDPDEVQPTEFVTVKAYVPAVSPEIVVAVPLPLVVTAPGIRVIVQFPVAGSPLIAVEPVATEHVGCVMTPITGADGVTGCALITMSGDDAEVHPDEFITVKEYVPGASPAIVVDAPLPAEVIFPGVLERVQAPVAGRPVSWMLPVAVVHVGCVTFPARGADGVTGCGSIAITADCSEVHPDAFVTVYVYVPVGRPAIVVVLPVPVVVMFPGVLVSVQVPDVGRLPSVTDPVATVHVGWIKLLVAGAAGVTGCSFIVITDDAVEMQPEAFVTVNV